MGGASSISKIWSFKGAFFKITGMKKNCSKTQAYTSHLTYPSSRCLGIVFKVQALQLESLTQLQEEPETTGSSTDQKHHGHPWPTFKTKWTAHFGFASVFCWRRRRSTMVHTGFMPRWCCSRGTPEAPTPSVALKTSGGKWYSWNLTTEAQRKRKNTTIASLHAQ